jgi:hypothetical protein
MRNYLLVTIDIMQMALAAGSFKDVHWAISTGRAIGDVSTPPFSTNALNGEPSLTQQRGNRV